MRHGRRERAAVADRCPSIAFDLSVFQKFRGGRGIARVLPGHFNHPNTRGA
jgi:hypothetical protein